LFSEGRALDASRLYTNENEVLKRNARLADRCSVNPLARLLGRVETPLLISSQIASFTMTCWSSTRVDFGSSNFPASSFLCTTMAPVPSQVRTFIVWSRFPTNTNSALERLGLHPLAYHPTEALVAQPHVHGLERHVDCRAAQGRNHLSQQLRVEPRLNDDGGAANVKP
jgi:hypothetical protein